MPISSDKLCELAYRSGFPLVDKYEAKLRSAQEATEKQTSVAKPQGTFYAHAAQNLRSDQVERRMLTATQEIVKHTKKTAELLKDGVGNGEGAAQPHGELDCRPDDRRRRGQGRDGT